MVNRRRDRVDGKNAHLTSNQIATKLREDIEALKKVRAHRTVRLYRTRRLTRSCPRVLDRSLA
jgi:ribosomal protein S13